MQPVPKRKPPVGDEQFELFAPTFVDVAFRDQQDLMENPLCSLGKKPRTEPIHYEVGDKYVRVTANSETGIATIYDHDVLIWAATQIREAADRGEATSLRVVFHPYNLLKSIRRDTGGREYELLKDAFRRLMGTTIETNIRLREEEKAPPTKRRRKAEMAFTLLQRWGTFEAESTEDDRWWFELPTWLYEGILNHKLVLSIDPEYFLMTSGIDRWLYRIFRKHAGVQENGWRFTMRQLHKKSGTTQRFSNFALEVRHAVQRANQENRIPGYHIEISRNAEGEEIVSGISRAQLGRDHPGFQPRSHPQRRLTPGGFANPPKHDNRAFAALVKPKKGSKAPAPQPSPETEDDIPF